MTYLPLVLYMKHGFENGKTMNPRFSPSGHNYVLLLLLFFYYC